MKRKILIVGGVAGGATAIARLRRLSEETELILFEKETMSLLLTVVFHTI